MTRVVCALSGGGAKSAAHLGVVRALDEEGLQPSHYVATSMGAVVAACLASGGEYADLVRRFTRLSRHDVAVLSPTAVLGYWSGAFLQARPLRETIARLVPARRFDELTVPLTVTAVDRQNAQLVLFGAGGREHVPLVDALYASCALPVYYPPARIAGRRYVDGGLRSVLPIDEAARFDPDLIVASSVGPSFYEEPSARRARLPALVRTQGDVLRIMMAAQTEDVIRRWTGSTDPEVVIVRPPTESETTFAVDKVVHYVEEGYRATVRELSRRQGAW